MKNLFNIPYILLISLLTIIFYSCEESIEKDNYEFFDESYKKVSVDQVKGLKNTLENLKSLTSIQSKQNKSLGIDNLVIDSLIEISRNGGKSYTLKIETNFEDSGYLENLHLIEVENGFISFIMKYEPTQEWINSPKNLTPKGDLVLDFKKFEGDITKLTLDREVLWSTKPIKESKSEHSKASKSNLIEVCFFTTTPMCNNDGDGQIGEPHARGINCTNKDFLYYTTESTCTYSFSGGGSSGGNDYGDTGTIGGGGSDYENTYSGCELTSGTLITDGLPVSGISTDCSLNSSITTTPIKTFSDVYSFLNDLEEDTKVKWNALPQDQKDSIKAFLEENKENDVYTENAMTFAEEVIKAHDFYSFNIYNFDFYTKTFEYYEGNSAFDDKAFNEALLTLYTNYIDPPWESNSGFYNDIPSLEYTDTRNFTYRGVPITQFKLTNGDVISQGDYGTYESDFKIFYNIQGTNEWFEMPDPSNYDALDVNFIFNHFWSDAAQPFARYFTPIEDFIILIEGKDFNGITQSRATAGLFILVDLVPGGKVLKITRKAGHTLSAASPVIKIAIDATTKAQLNLKNQWKNLIANASRARKGNFGEICTDIDFVEKGYEVVHVNRHTTIDPIGDNTGIDHIFKNPVTGEYVIVESKFHGTGGLSTLRDGTRQMSDEWIRGTNPAVLDSNNRLFVALGENATLYNQAVNNYKRVIAYIQANGTINYKYVSETGFEINTPFNN